MKLAIVLITILILTICYFRFVHKRGWFFRRLGIKVYCDNCRKYRGDACFAYENKAAIGLLKATDYKGRAQYEFIGARHPSEINKYNDCLWYYGEEEPW